MSDIEGSTRLIGVVGSAFARLLDEHQALMRSAVSTHHGRVVGTEGDSVFAVFPSARLAVSATIEAQQALDAHAWPSEVRLRVRMGIHAGEALMRGHEYAGLDVHRTARIMAAAWGGQVLVSDAVRTLVSDSLPVGVSLHELGEYRLRDMPGPERLYQLLAPGLQVDFPPVRTESVTTPTNLTAPLTPFVGRSEEVNALRALLATHRLVTLTGPGGSGKTRLSIETARMLSETFRDGVWLVAVDAVRDPQLVLPTIAQVLGVPEQPGRALLDTLAERLATKRILLVLDNLEQVIESAGEIARLLGATESLTILASSREPLSVAAEQVFPVQPLGLPVDGEHLTAADALRSSAVELFMDRAKATRPDFFLTDGIAPTIAAICRRLDGLPLAIELAAARVNVLTPNEILDRLDRSLALLATDRRDLSVRQRSLRGAIEWSHELLSPPERMLFRRCSVFAGGMDLDAVGSIVDLDGTLGQIVVDVVGGLVARSLLRSSHDDETTRLSMLETIREYAAEQLAASGEASAVRARHADYYAAMAERETNVVVDPQRDRILDRMDRELGNLRAAISWSLSTGQTDTGLRLAASLGDFWHMRNHIREGVRALEQLVAASRKKGDTVLRSRGAVVAGGLLTWLGEPERSFALAEQGTAMAERLGDAQLIAFGKSALGWSMFYRQPEDAYEIFGEGVAAARAAGNRAVEMECLMGQAWTHLLLGRPDEAMARANEVIDVGDRIGAPYITTFALLTKGMVAADRDEDAMALEQYREGLRRAAAAGAHVGTALALEAIASLTIAHGQLERGTRLGAAAERLRNEIGGNISLTELRREAPLSVAAKQMRPDAFDNAVEHGRQLSVEQAVAMALED